MRWHPITQRDTEKVVPLLLALVTVLVGFTHSDARSPKLSRSAAPAASLSMRADDGATKAVIASLSGSSLFVENLGQFDARVRFQVQSAGTTFWLAENALWMTVTQRREPRGKMGSNVADERAFSRGVHLKMILAGLDPGARLVAADPQPATMNYLLGRDASRWRSHVPTYGAVRWEGVHPGVDLVFRSAADGIVVTVEAVPGTSFATLRLRVEGADALRVDEARGLLADTRVGAIRLPQVLESDGSPWRPHVEGADAVFAPSPSSAPDAADAADTPGAPASASAADAPYGSDPVEPADSQQEPAAAYSRSLRYGTYLGAREDDAAWAIAVDAHGAAYVTGITLSGRFPTTPGAFDDSYNSRPPGFGGDVFVAKLDAGGTGLVYSTFLGGYDTDYGTRIALGKNGEVYVVGYSYSDDFPTTPGALSPTFNGGCCDVFIAKLDPSGRTLLYSTFLGGNSFEDARGLAVSPQGRAYITGETLSLDFPTTPGAYDRRYDSPNYSEAYVAVLNAPGSRLVYSTLLGGSYNDYGEGIALEADGSVHVTGRTMSRDFPTTPRAYDRSFNGGSGDGFLTKLTSFGHALVYSTYLGGRDDESGTDALVDASGGTFVTGYTASPDFPTTEDAFNRSCESCAIFADDAFVAHLGPAGRRLVYSTFLGGNSTDIASGLAAGPDNSVYVVGTTYSQTFPATSDALAGTLGGYSDAFVTRFNAGRALEYSTFLGGSGVPGGLSYEVGAAIAVQEGHIVYVAGKTGAGNFPTTTGALDRTYNGNDDVFVAKFRARPAAP